MMKSSSNFNRCLALLGAAAMVLGASEFAARFLIPRFSGIEGRVAVERSEARSLHSTPQHRQLLIVGNSLLEASVQVPAINAALTDGWQAKRFVIENTAFLDWFFGIKGLLEAGSRPDVLALMLSPKQLITNNLRGTYSSYHLFSAEDSFRAGRLAGYHPTEISGLLIGHFSAAYGLRTEIRSVAMQRAIPHAETIAQIFKGGRGTEFDWRDPKVRHIAEQRFDSLRALCEQYQIRCIFLPPAEPTLTDHARAASQIATAHGLAADQFLFSEGYATGAFQSDQFHMTQQGAKAYSAKLGPALAAWLAQPSL